MRQTCVVMRNFRGVVQPLLSNKIVYNKRITLTEDDKIVENDKNSASILNEVSSNSIITLGIPQYNETKPVGDILMKAIIKYRFHPKIAGIKKIVTWVRLSVSLRLNVMKS